jgi:peptidoglycan/LPS O-acetylase OafA/YrhL
MIKRFFRLYVPYIVSFFAAIIACLIFLRGGIPNLSSWFNSVWLNPIKSDTVKNQVLFLGNYNYGAYNPIYWSLVYEMRISIIFPFLILIIKKMKWYYNILIAFAFLYLGAFYNNNLYLVTLFYVFMFITGALLAKYRFIIHNYVKGKSKYIKLFAFIIGIILYTYEYWIPYIYSYINIDYKYQMMLSGIFITIGCMIFIVLSLSVNIFSKALSRKVIKYVGKISFSIYLYHCIALFSLIYWLYGKASVALIYIISLALTFILATMGYYLIEKPSIKLGKKLCENIKFISN